jgi:hypothetical protein
MAPRPLPAHQLEPAILRLQLELKIDRATAEPVVRAGYHTSGQVAAADDDEFHAVVQLPARPRAHILALARIPGSKAPEAGRAPVSARNKAIGPVILRGVAPVKRTVAKILGESERPRPQGPAAPKRPPPRAERSRGKRKGRRAAD